MKSLAVADWGDMSEGDREIMLVIAAKLLAQEPLSLDERVRASSACRSIAKGVPIRETRAKGRAPTLNRWDVASRFYILRCGPQQLTETRAAEAVAEQIGCEKRTVLEAVRVEGDRVLSFLRSLGIPEPGIGKRRRMVR